jgi:hypothetical protein
MHANLSIKTIGLFIISEHSRNQHFKRQDYDTIPLNVKLKMSIH